MSNAQFSTLVVDDTPANLLLMGALLDALGCQVAKAENGAEAVAAVEKAAYDVVFLDIHMPGMDGFDTFQALRAFTEVPIYAVTADTTDQTAQRCETLGFAAVIHKPVSIPLIASALSDVGQQASAGR